MNTKAFFLFFSLCLYMTTSHCQFGSEEILVPNLIAPNQLHLTDINSDGYLDVLCSSGEENKIAWFQNMDGQGQFSESISISDFPLIGNQIFPFDWDSDGDIDIILGSFEVDAIYWIENVDGQGQFGPVQFLADDLKDPTQITIEDLDGDNDWDILFVDALNFDDLFWLENNGLDEFAQAKQISRENAGIGPYHVVDIDADGDLDVICGEININGPDFFWYENLNGSADFSPYKVISNSSFNVRGITSGDFDGNGTIDLAYAAENQVVWVPNLNNSGSFGEEVEIVNPYFYGRDIEAIDLDGDNDLDLLVSSGSSGEISYFENLDGLGNFASEEILLAGFDNTSKIIINKIDDDNIYDFILQTDFNQNISFLKGTGPIDSYESYSIYQTNNIPYFDIGKVNNDDEYDILTASHIFHKVVADQDYSERDLHNQQYEKIQLFDIDGDGLLDITGYRQIGNDRKILWNKNLGGENNFTPAIEMANLNGITSSNFQIVDADDDNDLDVLYTSYFDGKVFLVRNQDGQGSFDVNNAEELFSDDDISVNNVYLSDLDLDGDNDMLVIGTNPNYLGLYRFNGLGNFQFAGEIDDPVFGTVATSADIDNDGDQDLLIGSFDGKLHAFPNLNGLLNYGSPVLLHTLENSNSSVTYIHTFDHDNDGDLDIGLDDGCCGNNTITILENLDGSDAFPLYDYFEVDNTGSKGFKLQDIDADGDIDVLVPHNRHIGVRKNYAEDPHIKGTIFWDENDNSIQDNNEIGLNNHQLHVQPNGLIQWSFNEGYYSFPVAPDTYELACEPAENWILTTDSLQEVTLLSYTDSVVVNFGVQVDSDTIIPHVDLTSAPTRCGFTVPFWLNYSINSYQLENGFVKIELDSLASFVEAFPAPDQITDSTLIWDFEELFPFSENGIDLRFEIADANNIGSVIFMQAIMGTYDDSLQITATDTSFFESTINCAYDPNDKLVSPSFEGFDNYTLFGEELTYTVRFQNTGTDIAFNVFIEDQLDSSLDWSTFEVIAASHTLQTTLNSFGKVVFRFDDIFLPSVQMNETLSHGFVKYKIKPKEDLAENTYVFNTASIFFDYNEPIITNTVSNIYVSGFPVVEEMELPTCPTSSDGSILIQLPEDDFATFEWSNGKTGVFNDSLATGHYAVTVFDPNNEIINIDSFFLPAPDTFSFISYITPSNATSTLGSASILVSGGTLPYSPLFWYTDPPDESIDPNELYPGTYNIIVTDANQCMDTTSIQVGIDYEPAFQLSDPSCFNSNDGSIELSDILGYLDYNWNTGENGPNLFGLDEGQFIVTITDTINQEILAIDTFSLIEPNPIELSNTITPNNGSSIYGAIDLTPSGDFPPFTFDWNTNPPQQSQNINTLDPGVYAVTVSDGNNCTNVDSITVPLNYDFQAIVEFPLCADSEDGSIEVLSIWPLIQYEWNNGSTEQTLENLGNGTYNLTVTDDQNNYLIDTVFTFNIPALEIAMSSTNSFPDVPNGTATASVSGGTPPYSYNWNTTPVQTNAIAFGLAPGAYSVTITDSNNCITTGETEVGVFVGAEELVTELQYEIYPNPTDEIAIIQFSLPESKDWNLFINNNIGQIIQHYSNSSSTDLDQKILVKTWKREAIQLL